MNTLTIETYIKHNDEDKVPVIFPLSDGQKPTDFLAANREFVDTLLEEHGAVLLRGFAIHSVSEFNRFALTYSPNLLEYNNRSTPRTRLGGNIYTSTEYPSTMVIPQHNENAYTNSWPSKLLFYSAVAAESGGETPLADSRNILKRMDDKLIQRLEDQGLMYVRNYRAGLDLSWQEVFQTDNKEDVNKYCRDNTIAFEWLEGGEHLRTKQIVQATTVHPKTKAKVWFNQINLFHIAATGIVGEELIREYGLLNVPRNVYFGDGSTIDEAILKQINEAITAEKFCFTWVRGDILLVDNLLMSHGRNAYTGSRKIAVAMV